MGEWTAQNISVNVDKFIEFLKANKKADGYVNLNVKKRRQPSEGNTHYIVVDTYQKSEQKPDSPAKAAFRQGMQKPAQDKNEEPPPF